MFRMKIEACNIVFEKNSSRIQELHKLLPLGKMKVHSLLPSLKRNFQGVQGDENMRRVTSHTGHNTFISSRFQVPSSKPPV